MPTGFIDFQEIKSKVSIEDAIPMLALSMKATGDQWRGPCPRCKSGGDRALVVTKSKQAFYCHAMKNGGDVIALVAHVRELGVKEAAQLLATHFGTVPVPRNSTVPGTVPKAPQGQGEGARTLQPLGYLVAEHEAVQARNVAKETATFFEAGYAPKGIMRGRLAIPIHTFKAELVAYVGVAVTNDQQPKLLFPNGFDYRPYIFNAHRIEAGDVLYVGRDPLEVLIAHQNGVTNMVSFFGERNHVATRALAELLEAKDIPDWDLI